MPGKSITFFTKNYSIVRRRELYIKEETHHILPEKSNKKGICLPENNLWEGQNEQILADIDPLRRFI